MSGITDLKIQAGDLTGRQITELGDRPGESGMTAAGLKAMFDNLPLFMSGVSGKFNALIDYLAENGGSGSGSAPYTAEFDTDDFATLSGTDYKYCEITAAVHGRGVKPVVECIQKAIVSGDDYDYEEVFAGYKVFVGGKIWIISNEAFKGRAQISNGGI